MQINVALSRRNWPYFLAVSASIIVVFLPLTQGAATNSDKNTDSFASKELDIGIVTSLSGPVGETGKKIISGLQAAFGRHNSKLGSNGRMIRTIFLDDRYDPIKTIELSKQQISQNRVFALTGYNGTATIKAVLPLVIESNIPFLFPRSGDQSLRTFHKFIFNLRPAFRDEVGLLLRYAADQQKKRVAIIYQQDAFGDSIRTGAMESLSRMYPKESQKDLFVSVAAMTRAEVNPGIVQEAFDKLDKGNPDVVLLAAAIPLSEPIIRMAQAKKRHWMFLAISSTGNLIAKIANTDAEVVVSQVVPNPADNLDLPFYEEFKSDLAKFSDNKSPDLQTDYTVFETYINGRAISEAIAKCGENISQSSFVKKLESDGVTIGNLKIKWSDRDHNGDGRVYLTLGRKGKFESIDFTPK